MVLQSRFLHRIWFLDYIILPKKKINKILENQGRRFGFLFSGEVTIALNEDKIDLHAIIKVKVDDIVDGKPVNHLIETTVGRVVFNKYVPKEVGFYQ